MGRGPLPRNERRPSSSAAESDLGLGVVVHGDHGVLGVAHGHDVLDALALGHELPRAVALQMASTEGLDRA